MSQLKFEEKEAEEDMMKAALFVEEGQGEEEGAPQVLEGAGACHS